MGLTKHCKALVHGVVTATADTYETTCAWKRTIFTTASNPDYMGYHEGGQHSATYAKWLPLLDSSLPGR